MATNDVPFLVKNAAGRWVRNTIAAKGFGLFRHSGAQTSVESGSVVLANNSSVVVTNTVTETTLLDGNIGSPTLSTGSCPAGRIFLLHAHLVLLHTSGTHTLRFKIGGTTVLTMTTPTLATTNILTGCVTNLGESGGNAQMRMWMKYDTSIQGNTSTQTPALPGDIDLTVEHSIADAGNNLTVHHLNIIAL